MIPAPISVDEVQRLADLHSLQLLDTPYEERFDRLTQLASQVLNVPMAFLSLVDSDRQWFKSKCGVTPSETGRGISFCGHAIMQTELMIVPDALLDHRFHDNPLVVGDPFIRFYAGHPIQGKAGYNVGTFCIAGNEPRVFDDQERHVFCQLAAIAQHELQMLDVVDLQNHLLGTQRDLLESQERLIDELREAAAYIESRLPARLQGTVESDWCFLSSSQLGGDFFDHQWLSESKLAFYLLDVCGHGVGACLFSASIQDALRSRTLGDCHFDRPAEVVSALNRAFRMDDHGDRFFTIWYAVYDKITRRLEFSSGGHHAALLFGPGDSSPKELNCGGMAAGVADDSMYESDSCAVPAGSRVYLFSDGAFEVDVADGDQLGIGGLAQILSTIQSNGAKRVDESRIAIESRRMSPEFQDDFSLLELTFL